MKNENSCIRVYADQQQIASCKEELQENAQAIERISGILALAGNEVRLKILYMLSRENELCPCDLSDILEMSMPAVSQHLRKMKDARVIISRRAGQTMFYSLENEASIFLTPIFEQITKNEIV